MTPLKITDARAKELEALYAAATPLWIEEALARIISFYGCGGDSPAIVVRATPDGRLIIEAHKALRDFIADRRVLLDALRRAVDLCRFCKGTGTMGTATLTKRRAVSTPCPSCADLRALLASAEGEAK